MQSPPPGASMRTAAAAHAAPVIEAMVHTAATETVYRRAGSGAQIVLVTADAAAGGLGELLFDTLALHFRVFAPRVDGRPAGVERGALAFVDWIREVIDGLGLERPGIVVDEAFGAAALAFAMLDPERVGRLVVVCHGPPDRATGYSAVDDVLARSGHPILLIGQELGHDARALADGASDVLLRFLAGERAGAHRSGPARGSATGGVRSD